MNDWTIHTSFNDGVLTAEVDNVEWDWTMISNGERVRIWKEAVMEYFNVISRTQESSKKPQWGQMVTRPEFKPSTSQIQVYSLTDIQMYSVAVH
jgi:hypothetical protein